MQSSTPPLITPQSLVSDVMSNFPETIPVFLGHQMICVGCAMASFDTLEDAAKNYAIPMPQLMAELNAKITRSIL